MRRWITNHVISIDLVVDDKVESAMTSKAYSLKEHHEG